MQRNALYKWVLWITLCLLTSTVYAFGQNGHRIIAHIAESHLQDAVKERVMRISHGLPLASMATWADEIRVDEKWDKAKPWHYISVDHKNELKQYQHSSRGDVVKALLQFEAILKEEDVKGQELWQALAFYIHFVGDIHQPLHVGRRDDKGGNTVKVKWFERPSNLHAVWDYGMIDRQRLSFTEYASFINNPSAAAIKQWQGSDYWDWVHEAIDYREDVYRFGSDNARRKTPKLGYGYMYQHKPYLDTQLLKAGVRLAGKLNQIFGAR